MSRHEIDPVTREPFEQQPTDIDPGEDVRLAAADSVLRDRRATVQLATLPSDADRPVDIARG